MYRNLIILGMVLFCIPLVSGALEGGATAIRHWDFNGDALDDSGNDCHLSVTGATQISNSSCIDGGCYFFDNVDDRLLSSCNLNTTAYTIYAWYRDYNPSDSTANMVLDIGPSGARIFVQSNTLKYRHYKTAGTITEPSIGYTSTDMHCIAGSFDGNNAVLYLDGIEQDNHSDTNQNYNGDGIGFGTRYSSSDFDLHGIVDDAGIFNEALTSDEIYTLCGEGFLAYPYNAIPSGDDCDYSGSGDWFINENCHIDTNSRLETGKTLFVSAGYTAWVDSGVVVK